MDVWKLVYEEKYFNKCLHNGLIIDSGILFEFFKLIHEKNGGKNLSEQEKILLYRLERILSLSQKYITPHILAELSNLINTKICGAGSEDFNQCIILTKEELNKEEYSEIHLKKEEILETQEVLKYGVTDAGIILISKKEQKFIFTADKPLSEECKRIQNLPVMHIDDLESLFLTIECLNN